MKAMDSIDEDKEWLMAAYNQFLREDAEELALLDREMEEYQRNPEAGASWDKVKNCVRSIQS
jgi:hypothetical protein